MRAGQKERRTAQALLLLHTQTPPKTHGKGKTLLSSLADAAAHARVAADAAVAGADADRVAGAAPVARLHAVAIGHVGRD